jgi:hypothetical protein
VDGVAPEILVRGETLHGCCSVAGGEKRDVFAGGSLSS